MKKYSLTTEFAGRQLTFETGSLAGQATTSVLARLGDTMVLVTIVASSKQSSLDYFPLSVEYVERLYAGGRIKGSRWVKREGRPSDDAVLTGRLIDRSIRPLFPKEYKNDVQVVITVLSVDGENEPDILALNAVSAALTMSRIPWSGPVAAVRIGYDKESQSFVVNPGGAQLLSSELDLVVSQSQKKTLMIEAGASQVSEEMVLSAIEKAHEETGQILSFIETFAEKAGKQPKDTVEKDALLYECMKRIEKNFASEVRHLIGAAAVKESSNSQERELLIEKIFEQEQMLDNASGIDKKTVSKALEKVFYGMIRKDVIENKKRADGRQIDEVRPIGAEVSLLPRTHGSAVFQRGATQALTVVTLGSSRLEQLIESAEGEEKKRYIHHYSMPPYSVGETGRMGTPSRREIGHGALAERALMPVIPTSDTFPYTIRVVSEILSSNGSTSMASTCGSTLALMDAGVPILKPVSGIAMGMMSRPTTEGQEDEYVVLTDIIGLEDFSGDMDFKVAGTDSGITAIQLDVKTHGLTMNQIREILPKAKTARLFILDKMLSVLSTARQDVSTYAPKIAQLRIPVEKIGEVIGPGGRVIKNIIATTGATVDVEDDGTVSISGISEEEVQKATEWIEGLTREVQVGEEFDECEVKRILPFGAFVEFLPGKEGMVHISKMSSEFVNNPHDVVHIGQKVKVRVAEIDDQGRINLSMVFGEQADRPQRNVHFQENPAQKEHPLSMQFKRERMQRNKPIGGGQRNGRQRFPRKSY